MKRAAMAIAVLVLFSAVAQAQTAPPVPGPEHKRLSVFVGTWTGTGKAETTPFGKGGPVWGTMTCAWFEGGFHLICDSDDTTPGGKMKSHSVYGYDVEKKQYVSFGVDSTGFGGPGTARVEGSTWTFEASAPMGGKTFWFRSVVRLLTSTELTYRSLYSEDGKTWTLMVDGKMVKAKPGGPN
jgi:hypothetical protein